MTSKCLVIVIYSVIMDTLTQSEFGSRQCCNLILRWQFYAVCCNMRSIEEVFDANRLARCNEWNVLCFFNLFLLRQELRFKYLSLSLAIEPVQAFLDPPIHLSFLSEPNAGSISNILPYNNLLCLLLQDNYHCRMHDGSQEVPAGRTELHPGDRELWVEKAFSASRLRWQAEG